MVHIYCDLPVRLHACSPPRLTATQLARSAVLNRLIAPTGLSPALTPDSLGAPEITGRPSASQIKATDPKRWAPITDEQLEVQILFILQKEGSAGMNATVIAGKLNQDPVWIRRWIKRHPNVLKRVGAGPGTRFFAPQARSASIH